MNLRVFLTVVIFACTFGWKPSAGAEVQDRGIEDERRDLRGDELRERVPAVTGHLFLKNGRHEILPMANISIADAFTRKYLGGLGYTMHVNEYFAITVRGGFTLMSTHAGSYQVCPTPTDCRLPLEEELARLPGNMNLMLGVLAEYSPVYGKINLLAERVLHFDTYATAGIGAVHYSFTRDDNNLDGTSPSLLLGIGQRYFINEWLALRFEILDVIYMQPTILKDRQIKNEFLFLAGISIFFPTTFTQIPYEPR